MKIIIYTKEKQYNFKSFFDKDYDYALKHAYKEDGPAYIRYFNNKIEHKKWLINGKCHRADGPAVINYFHNGNIKQKSWYTNGKLNQEDGPAVIWYFENGNICHKTYYLNNQYYSKTEFNQILLKKKLQLI